MNLHQRSSIVEQVKDIEAYYELINRFLAEKYNISEAEIIIKGELIIYRFLLGDQSLWDSVSIEDFATWACDFYHQEVYEYPA